MKFWEWEILCTGILCVLSADSSIGWCAVLAIFCLFGIIMRQWTEDVAADTRRSRAQKSTTPMAVESDAWIGHCKSDHVPDNNITIWDEWQ
jgi:hypothetical protein